MVFYLLLLFLFSLFIIMLGRVLFCWYIVSNLAYIKLKKNGFGGPIPSFPLGNIHEMKKRIGIDNSNAISASTNINNDIHSNVFPYFAKWQKSHGKVFTYWLGTEPFLYIADPKFLKEMSTGVMGKSWGKPTVFKNDRKPMFGNGLIMTEGEDWVRHRHLITPAFSPANLKAMASSMAESTTSMLDRWTTLINSGHAKIDMEREIINTAGEIIAKTSFGMNHENGIKVFSKLRAMQMILFKTTRYIGVPFSRFMQSQVTLEAEKLGIEIDRLLIAIIDERKRSGPTGAETDLLGLMLTDNRMDGKKLTTRELVDECKTFFFGGHETTALALTWTMLLLSVHPEWQEQLREEIREVVGDGEIDATMLVGLKKMGWVMNEVLRLYSPAPNAQRQAREDIKVGNKIIPNGTNMWIDLVSIHHDREFWGDDVNEFKPERFRDDMYGGCKHKMGFLPFGFGGRMCIGRNLTMMEYKIVLTLILRRFSFSLSPDYCHSPSIMLSLRPAYGLPLLLHPLDM